MSFLYPLFLFAGALLAIPILIHLFNLRKYKTVLFPHTRFLKNIQLHSRKQSQVRYKALLAARLLFLAFLILAFARPYFTDNQKKSTAGALQIIYLDNSNSMTARKGARTLFEIARDAAARQVAQATPGTKFILLTNNKPTGYLPEPADKIYAAIQACEPTAATRTTKQVLAQVQSMRHFGESATTADLYYYSDFQATAFPALPDTNLLAGIHFYGLPVQAGDVQDVHIDTAWLTTPVLQTGKTNQLVIRTRNQGKPPKESPVLNLSINGQVKSAASLDFSGKSESIDTLSFQVANGDWQNLELTINDASLRFNDTFRIAARSAPSLSVLVLNEGAVNPYIQASFRAYDGFRLQQTDVATAPQDWSNYNLIILNNITRPSEALGTAMAASLDKGQSICIFPGRTINYQPLNDLLKTAGDIAITAIDTAVQAASTVQQGSALVKDLFERLPDNVQLPVTNWHYSITAGLSANQQSVLSFRNGDPLLARYTPARGQLYICATAADLLSGNFPGSYFFTPFLYQMAMQSGSSSIYAITAGSQEPLFLPLTGVSSRGTVHLLAHGTDIIPPQRPSGAGLQVFAGQSLQQPGFYSLVAEGSDTARLAINHDKTESDLQTCTTEQLEKLWAGQNITWLQISTTGSIATSSRDSLPLWKICLLVALAGLAIETILLCRPPAKVATA